MNEVTLSEDRMEMWIRGTTTSGDVATATLRSARENGFTDADVERASTFEFTPLMRGGQVNRAWVKKRFGYTMSIAVNTGPPTWWFPRFEISRKGLMVGWFRGLIGIHIKRN